MSKPLYQEIHLNGHIDFQVQIELDDSGAIASSQVHAVGGYDFLQKVNEFRGALKGTLADLPVPEGNDFANMIVREMVLRIKGEWKPPYTEDNICHCRAVATAKVDQAILYGAHKTTEISAQTSASTACGTCREDVQSMIDYRKGS